MLHSVTSTWRRLSNQVHGFVRSDTVRVKRAVLPKTHRQPLEVWEDEGGKPAVIRA
jgi:hypothetical protein